jgi:hypothetical protein
VVVVDVSNGAPIVDAQIKSVTLTNKRTNANGNVIYEQCTGIKATLVSTKPDFCENGVDVDVLGGTNLKVLPLIPEVGE